MNHDKWTSSQFWLDHLYFPALKKSSKFYSKTTLQEHKLTLKPFCCTWYKTVPGLFTRFPMAPSMSVFRGSHIFPLNWNAMQSQCLGMYSAKTLPGVPHAFSLNCMIFYAEVLHEYVVDVDQRCFHLVARRSNWRD